MSQIRPTTRDAIMEAAFEIYNERPTASLGDIAAHAGVGRATLHRHFSSRDDLIIALAETAMQELDEAVTEAVADATTHSEGLRLALSAIIPLANRQWFVAHEALEDVPSIAEAYQEDMKELRADIEAAQAEGTFAPDVPIAWIAEAYENLIYTAWTLVRNGDATHAQAADLAWRTLTNGLKD